MLPALHTAIAGLVRRTWLLALVTIAICASFAAKAVASFVEPTESASSRLPVAPVATTKPTPARDPLRDSAQIVTRNMFCSTCAPASGEPGPAGASFVPDATLIATSVGGDPTTSRATVRVTVGEAQGSWGLGETIPSIGTIARIGYASVDVRDAEGRLGTLSLLDGAKVAGGAATSPAAVVASANPYDDHVRKIDDHTYDVERSLVRDLVNGATTGKGGIRAMPNMVKGELAGIRLLGVSPDSAPAAIGLHAGDVISTIDGETIKTAQQMIDLYGKIDKVNSVELGGTRLGKPLAMRLNLK